MALPSFDCRACGADGLEEIAGFFRLSRVTSDCKPFPPGGRLAVCGACGAIQKPADARWVEEAAQIYGNYQPYYQSGGVEQAVFDPAKGVPRRRSTALLEGFVAHQRLTPTGSVLDVGCGNGVLLSAFAEVRPHWRLFGHELSDLHAAALSRIPGFAQLYTGPLADVPAGFDVVTMIHALEHFSDPLAGLRELRPKLNEGGRLFIEVPNGEATPFDLVIADHASHFARNDLARLLKRADYGAAVIADDWVTKEISVVALREGPIVPLPAPAAPADVCRRVESQIAWLQAVVDDARAAARRTKSFGVFGTSIAAMWLFGQVGNDVAFFVDEDPSRKNAMLFDRPVLVPEDAPAGASIYVALIPQVARAVAARIGRPGIELSVPPEIGRSHG